MSRATQVPKVGDKIEVMPSASQALFGTGPTVTAYVTGLGREQGQPVVDYKTLSGLRRWAYLFQVQHVYEPA